MEGLNTNVGNDQTNRQENTGRGLSEARRTPKMQDRFGNTLLHAAAVLVKNDMKLMQDLLDAGADPRVVNKAGYTSLHYAVIYRNRMLVEELLQAGADVNAGSLSGNTALHYAVDNQGYEFLDLSQLLRGRVPTVPDIKMIQMLLEHNNINIDAVDVYGETPLMRAVVSNWRYVVKMLLLSGANPNICNTNGQTPLHAALQMPKPNVDILFYLLANGADLFSLNRANQTPIDILVDSIRNEESLNCAKIFLKMVFLHFNLRKKDLSILERNSELAIFQLACRKEVSLMEKQIITQKLTVHDFLLCCWNENQFGDIFVNIHKPLVEILITGEISLFLFPLLCCIGRTSLWKILKLYIELNGEKDFEQTISEELQSVGIKNKNLNGRNLSVNYIFKLIKTYALYVDLDVD